MDPLSGTSISHYHVIEKLGEGGMGVVYKAGDTRLDRDVALKFLPPHESLSEPERSRFIHEAKAASALDHPNICTIHEIDETPDGRMFIVMGYHEGLPLSRKLKSGPLAVPDAVAITIQVAEGLQAAHARGIVHRDIKSSNVSVADNGQVKILDFGVAQMEGLSRVTRAGATVGTAAYMSPEQARGDAVDHRSDLWSLGVMIYEMVTGRIPFRGEHDAAILYSVVNEEPQPGMTVGPAASPALTRIIRRALEKNVGARYQTATEILSDLRRVQSDGPGTGFREAAAGRRGPAIRRPHVILAAAMFGLVVSTAIYILGVRTPSHPEIGRTIAVLPFKNLSDNREDEYFSDGITEDIIVQLSKIEDVKVLSRTSTLKYKQSTRGPREIGRELDVATVLEGSVRRAGNRVRVVAQLIDAQSEGHLWAETYDKDLDQIFAVQSDLAQRIASALRVRLSAEERARILRKPTERPDAYERYLKGRFYWNKRSEEGIRKALQYYREALEVDSLYAKAYAGVADCYLFLDPSVVGGRGATYQDTYTGAKEAALRALTIDSTLAEAHTTLAFMLERRELAWTDAEAHYLRAIELDPEYPTAHQWYGLHLILRGRTTEGIAEVQHALALDPISLMINADLGLAYYWARRYDDGIAQLQKTLDLDSTYVLTYGFLGSCYYAKGWKGRAVNAYLKGSELERIDPETIGRRRRAFEKGGWRGYYQERLREHLTGGSINPHTCADYYMRLDDPENAIIMLERGFREGAPGRYNLGCSVIWDPLRSDPRFIALLKRAGFQH